MLRIGITGVLASGKSSVASFWATRFRSPACSADQICRNLLRVGEPGWLALSKKFGNRFFKPTGQLDRPALRTAIFHDSACRQTVNRLLHPLARQVIQAWMIAESQDAQPPLVLLAEVPLLFEAGWQDDFDVTVAVYASRERCLERLCRRDKVTPEEAAAALAAQLPPEEKTLLAHHVLDNNGAWPDTCLQLIHLGNLLAGKKLDTRRVGKI